MTNNKAAGGTGLGPETLKPYPKTPNRRILMISGFTSDYIYCD